MGPSVDRECGLHPAREERDSFLIVSRCSLAGESEESSSSVNKVTLSTLCSATSLVENAFSLAKLAAA